MKIKLNSAGLVALVFAASWLAAAVVRAQQAVASPSDFSSVEYFDPPHALQMKSRMSGASASPLSGGLLAIKQLKLEMFNTNGATEAVVEAPDCVYDTQNGLASSPGHLQMRSGDGNLRIDGEGFLWRQADRKLTISNHVETVIDGAFESKTGL